MQQKIIKQSRGMKKDLIFFSDKGLTSTSANHVANLAKEYVRGLEKELQSIRFVTTTVELLSGEKPKTLTVGKDMEFVSTLTEKLNKLAEAKSLIAWLREAIKARDSLKNELTSMTLKNFCEKEGIEIPVRPEATPAMTEDDYYGSLGIKERNRYFYLETLAATIGSFIHPDGALFKAREDLKEIESNPITLKGEGVNAVLYSKSATVDKEIVEDKYFELQKIYRGYQAELNKIKYDCQTAIEASQIEANAIDELAMSNWCSQFEKIEELFKQYITKEKSKVQALKIVIPDSLQKIYEEVSSLGKK